ncbi:hypothetical protein EYC84_001170 [Monilinia fructicola]|uniref:Cytochrome b561 domain-containing protein n=1 Tax=Monilinia fructicola TaxID=38448 RepID=A0A5M9JP29_MONFR|nr:hypothetical protein EYC84_001170 [Monilinia fructicola]
MVRMIWGMGAGVVSLAFSIVNAISTTATATATKTATSTSTSASTSAAAAFIANDTSVKFALNIPNENPNNDLYFSISGPSSCSWIAVGMGSDKMKNSLIPRIASDQSEPSHAKDIVVDRLTGTGISNDTFTWHGRCLNCTSWQGGSLGSTANKKANFIWANGPPITLKSDSLHADIKRHSSYGVFTMDLSRAIGTAGVPAIPTSNSEGTIQVSETVDNNFSSAAHAVLMVLVFVGLLPLGIVILRFLNSPRWHAVNQTISLGIALVGVGLGAQLGTLYNRTKGFKSGHQIIGVIVVIAMLSQWVLGFLHHRLYKQTSTTTKFAPIHVWLGRVVIPAGIINGFIGFPLALNPKLNWALLACTLLVIIIFTPLLFWGWKRRQAKEIEGITGQTEGYDAEPWRSPQAQYDIGLNQMNMNMHMNTNMHTNTNMNMSTNLGGPPPYHAGGQQMPQQQQQWMPSQSSHSYPAQQGTQFV